MNYAEKKCTKCKTNKSLELFKKNNNSKDGFSSWCKECHCKSVCAYQKKNRDKANAANKKYKNTLKGRKSIRKYKLSISCKKARKRYNDSELGMEAKKRWRSKRKFYESKVLNTLTKDQWNEILDSQGNKCKKCGIVFTNKCMFSKAEKDHIIPVSKGGHTVMENIQALCRKCNAIKGVKIKG